MNYPLRTSLKFPANASGTGCVIVGEVAQSHDGSLGLAHAFIDAIASAGADAVKFQTHIAAAESTPGEPWRVKFSRQDATRYDYWQRMEFTERQWRGLEDHAEERGLLFLSSPFSLEAVELLGRLGMAAWKIASGEVSNLPLLERDGPDEAADAAVVGHEQPARARCRRGDRARGRGVPFAVMQCTLAYPCPPEKIGLNMLDDATASATAARSACRITPARSIPGWPPRRSAPTCWRCTSR